MSPANGHANGAVASQSSQTTGPLASADMLDVPATPPFASQRVQELCKELEVPFDPSVIEWRVTNTAKGEQRGQVVPYADPRAYTDRLNEMFTPAGWTRKYAVHTSANFERAKDKKIVAKVLITCELTVFDVGSHSATGEEFADNENALTAAEAQAFKRSCACFGLGRYLYYFKGVWVDLDERKRPTSVPRLFDWATPQGWREGRRPRSGDSSSPASALDDFNSGKVDSLIHEIGDGRRDRQTVISRRAKGRCESLESDRDSRSGSSTNCLERDACRRWRTAPIRCRPKPSRARDIDPNSPFLATRRG
jgi:hypothetical protein